MPCCRASRCALACFFILMAQLMFLGDEKVDDGYGGVVEARRPVHEVTLEGEVPEPRHQQ